MTKKLICPECGSDYVRHLAIGVYNPYMYLCGECGERWGDVSEELKRYKIQMQVHPEMAFYDYIDATDNDLDFPEAEEKLVYLRKYLSDGAKYRAVER